MQRELDVVDFSEFVLSMQADIDDITLSQVCYEMEKRKSVFKGFYKLTLSLTMYAYGYSPHTRSLDHMV